MSIDLREQVLACRQPQGRNFGRQRQTRDLKMGVGGIAHQAVRLPSRPEKPRRLAGWHDIVVQTHHIRQPDRGEPGGSLARLEPLDHRTEIRPVVRADLPRLLTGVRISGKHPVPTRVMKVAVRANRPHNGELVGPRRRARQQLAETNARNVRLDRGEFATNLGGRIGFRVEGLMLGRSTLQPQKNDVLRPSERTAHGLAVTWFFARREQRRQRQAERAQAANSQKFAERCRHTAGWIDPESTTSLAPCRVPRRWLSKQLGSRQ